LIEATESLLFKLDPGGVARAILAELPNVNERDAAYLARYFAIGFANLSGSGTPEEWRVAMTAAAPQIASRVLELSRDDTDSIVANRGARLLVAVSLTLQAKLDVAAVPGFLAHCRVALRSQTVIEAFSAAMFLAYFEPDVDGLVETLGRMVGHSEWGLHAAGVLCQLGARAQTAVPSICDMLLTSKDYQEIVNLSSGLVQISRALGDPECDSAIAYLEKAREQVSPVERVRVDQLVSRIRKGTTSTGIMPGGGGMLPAAGRGSMVPGRMLGTRPGMRPGMMPGAGSMMPGSGSMMPGSGSMMPGSGLPGGTVPGEGSMSPGSGLPSTTVDATPADAENQKTPGTSDGTSQAPTNTLPGGSLGSGAGLTGALPGESGGVSDGVGAQEMYDGKSYSQWMSVLETERSPDRLLEALKAIRELMPEGDDARVAGVLLRLMRTYGDALRQSGARGNLVSAARSQFGLLSAEGIIQAVSAELPKLNYDQAEFLSEVLRSGFRDPSSTTSGFRSERAGWCDAIKNAAPQLVAEALELSRRTDGSVDIAAMLNFAETLSMLAKLDVRQIEGFLPRFREALRSEDDRAVLAAASVLVIHEPETEGLAEVVIRFLGNARDGLRTRQLLRALGPRAKPVVPEMIETMLHPKNNTDVNDLLIAIVHIGDIAIPDLEAARTGADTNAAKRIDHAIKCIKNRSFQLVAPYGTTTELYELKDTATPTEATSPQESDDSTPNAEPAASDSSPPDSAAPGPGEPKA
jgi:hypothetical protein